MEAHILRFLTARQTASLQVITQRLRTMTDSEQQFLRPCLTSTANTAQPTWRSGASAPVRRLGR
jgi:hypothetical protein